MSALGVEGDLSTLGVPVDPLLRARFERRGDVPMLSVLFRAHRSRLVGLAAAITLDRHTAEEVVQDAFVGLHRHLDDVDNPVGYLQRAVINLSLNASRRRRWRAGRPVAERSVETGDAEIDETWAAVAGLPTRQRAVVALRFYEDLTIDAIAATLDVPAGSVKSTLHRAMRRLEEELR